MPDIRFFNYHQLSNKQLNDIREWRWKARTDLRFLCNHVLGYKDVCDVHTPLINMLQKFPEPNREQFLLNDDLSRGYANYTPVTLLTDLAKKETVKRRLILDFRGSLKTTINAMAHSIQWILNYPNASLLIIQSNIEKAEEILGEIKGHFQFNSTFRTLFPEHVPQKKIQDWGTKSQFSSEAMDVNNLALGQPHKEGTFITGGIDKGLAGKHVDVLKFSDIVDPNNSRTDTSCADVAKQYYLCENLLTSPIYWIDIEGTRYSFADLYGRVIKSESKLPPERRVWSIYVRGCYKKKTPDGQPQKFTPEELFLPDLVDDSSITNTNPFGKVSWWPERYPVDILEHKRSVAPFEFATQMYNNPQSAEEGMQPFPVTQKLPKFVKREDFSANFPKAYYEVSVDTAETDHQKSNFTAIVVACWTSAGNCVVDEIVHGKFLPDKLIKKLYDVYLKYKPLTIKIEETSFVRGLMAGIRKHGEIMGIYLPIELVKRDNKIAKQERILNTLQPYYQNGRLIFLDDIECKNQLLEELTEFPTGINDDILDALADLFQNKEYFGRLKASENTRHAELEDRAQRMRREYNNLYPKMTERWLGFNVDGAETPGFFEHSSYSKTGGL